MEVLGLSFLSSGGRETETRACMNTHHRESLIKGGTHDFLRAQVKPGFQDAEPVTS